MTTQWPISTIYISPSKDFPLSISLNLVSKARIECIYIFQLLNAVRIQRQTTFSRQFRFYNICCLHQRWKTVVVLNHCFVQSGLHTFNREPFTVPSMFGVWQEKGKLQLVTLWYKSLIFRQSLFTWVISPIWLFGRKKDFVLVFLTHLLYWGYDSTHPFFSPISFYFRALLAGTKNPNHIKPELCIFLYKTALQAKTNPSTYYLHSFK